MFQKAAMFGQGKKRKPVVQDENRPPPDALLHLQHIMYGGNHGTMYGNHMYGNHMYGNHMYGNQMYGNQSNSYGRPGKQILRSQSSDLLSPLNNLKLSPIPRMEQTFRKPSSTTTLDICHLCGTS